MGFFLPYILSVVTLPYWIKLLKERIRITNFKGRQVAAPAGLSLAVNLVVAYIFSPLWGVEQSMVSALVQFTVFLGLTGFIDDFLGKGGGASSRAKGLSGHLRALADGHLTSGLIKLFLLSLLGFYFSLLYAENFPAFISGLLLIPLAANTMNLLDIRPVRAIKGFWFLSLPLLLAADYIWQIYLPLLGVLIPYFPLEAKEEVMLGDTGANLLGGLLGYFYQLIPGWQIKLFLILFLLFLNLSAERVSFSRVIQENPVLSYLDLLGRKDS